MKRILTVFILLLFVTCGAMSVWAGAQQPAVATEITDRTFRREPLPASDEVQQLRMEIQIFTVLGRIAALLIPVALVWIIVACIKNRKLKSEISRMQQMLYGLSKEIMPMDLVISFGIAVFETYALVLLIIGTLNGFASRQDDASSVLVIFLAASVLWVLICGFLSLLGFILAISGLKSRQHRAVAVLMCIWHGLHLLGIVCLWLGL